MVSIDEYARYKTFLFNSTDVNKGKLIVRLSHLHAEAFDFIKKDGSGFSLFAGTTPIDFKVKEFNWVAQEAVIEVDVPEAIAVKDRIRINIAYESIGPSVPKIEAPATPVDSPETQAEEKPRSKRGSKTK